MLRYCAEPTCGVLVPKGRCAFHARERERQRPNITVRHWYYTARWKALRQLVLHEMPVCTECQHNASRDVDHIIPHRGDPVLFWDVGNLQALCTRCHSRKTGAGG